MTEICISALTQGAVCLREVSSGICLLLLLDYLSGSVVKNPPANARDTGSIPDLGRSSRRDHGNPLSILAGNPYGQGSLVGNSPWVPKSQTRLSGGTTAATTTIIIISHQCSLTSVSCMVALRISEKEGITFGLALKIKRANDEPIKVVEPRNIYLGPFQRKQEPLPSCRCLPTFLTLSSS